MDVVPASNSQDYNANEESGRRRHNCAGRSGRRVSVSLWRWLCGSGRIHRDLTVESEMSTGGSPETMMAARPAEAHRGWEPSERREGKKNL